TTSTTPAVPLCWADASPRAHSSVPSWDAGHKNDVRKVYKWLLPPSVVIRNAMILQNALAENLRSWLHNL
ncbi:MAG: hypothetical protein ONB05_12105, partial [candidate division KSB1 bacterium]|nr:hypothetical protein [candidate division KSB1 bacterium]